MPKLSLLTKMKNPQHPKSMKIESIYLPSFPFCAPLKCSERPPTHNPAPTGVPGPSSMVCHCSRSPSLVLKVDMVHGVRALEEFVADLHEESNATSDQPRNTEIQRPSTITHVTRRFISYLKVGHVQQQQ